MDAQELRNLQEAYMEVVMNEAKVDDTMSDWKKLDARDKRHTDRLSPRQRRHLDMNVRSGDMSVNQNRQQAHKQRRGKRKPVARSIGGGGFHGKYYQASVEKKANNMSPEDIKKKKREDMLRRMGNAAARRGLFGGGSSAQGLGSSSGTGGYQVGGGQGYGISGIKLADSYDIYDIILSHLLDEKYAETPASAEAIMVNMSEEWRDSIIG